MSRLSEIQAKFTELFGWEKDRLEPVDFAMSAYFSTYLPGSREKSWGVLVGGPSSGKTEVLKTTRDADPQKDKPKRTVMLGDLTENCFASGYRPGDDPEKDPSILAKLDYRRNPPGPKMLVCTEMGTVLGLPKERRGRFFNQMRLAYDGDYDNNTGNLGLVYYKLGFGFLGAATGAIDNAMKEDQPLGQRMVMCRLNRDGDDYESDRRIALAVIRINPYTKKTGQQELTDLVTRHMNSAIEEIKEAGDILVGRPKEFEDQLSHMCTLVARMRTVPISFQTMTHSLEKPARITGQMVTWGDGRALFDGRETWNEGDLRLMRRILQDTLNPEFLKALRVLWGDGPKDAAKAKSINEIGFQCKLPPAFSRQWAQWDLAGLVVELDKGSYSFRPDMIDAIERCNFFEGVAIPT